MTDKRSMKYRPPAIQGGDFIILINSLIVLAVIKGIIDYFLVILEINLWFKVIFIKVRSILITTGIYKIHILYSNCNFPPLCVNLYAVNDFFF